MKIGDFRTMVPVVKARSTGGTEDFFFFEERMAYDTFDFEHVAFEFSSRDPCGTFQKEV